MDSLMDSLPSLLLTNYEFPPLGGGAGNATAQIARRAAARGCRVGVLTSRYRGQPAREEWEGVHLFRVPVLRRRPDRSNPPEMLTYVLSSLRHARAVARALRPDAAIAFMGIPSGPAAWWLKQTMRLPYLVSLRGGDVPGFLPKELGAYHRLTRPVTRRIWLDASALVANSRGLAETARANMPGFEIQVIPNGVDTDRFSPRAGERDPGPLRLLFAGRLAYQKNLPLLLAALGEVGDRAAVELLLAGDGPDRPQLEALAREGGIEDRVRFLGWVAGDDLPALYRRADVFVLPSFDEGMPNVMLEAMASGLPLIASRVSGNEELVVEGENGYLVPLGSPAEMAERLLTLAREPELRRRLAAGSRVAAGRYDWATVTDAYLQLVRSALRA